MPLQDLRYALRQLRNSPGFTLTAILTLGLGIGATASILSVIDAVLLKPLPFREPAAIMRITGYYPKGWIREWQRRSQTFSEVSGFGLDKEHNIFIDGASQRIFGSEVFTNAFELLGLHPACGHFFTPDQEQAGNDAVVVLSYGYWQQQFAGDPKVVGKTLRIDGIPRTVIGVMQQDANFPDAATRFWTPVAFKSGAPVDAWAYMFLQGLGRLKPGGTAAAATSEIRGLQKQLLPLFPWRMPDSWGAGAEALPLLESVVGDARPKLLLLFGAVTLVLLIACANVANLLLARAETRRREMAVRAAVGASAARLLRQALTESALLGMLAGLCGSVIALAGIQALKTWLPPETPRLHEVALDWRVWGFIAVVSLGTSLFFGIVPALRVTRINVTGGLRGESGSNSGTRTLRLPQFFVGGQIALTVLVLCSAVLLLHSFWKLIHIDPGFTTKKIVSAQVSLDESDCQKPGPCIAFYQTLLAKQTSQPGVKRAALVDSLPMTGWDETFVYDAEGHPRPQGMGAPQAASRVVSPEYFGIMGLHLLQGRLLTPADEANGGRVAIINRKMAERLWPGQNPIGKHIEEVADESRQGTLTPEATVEIVGIISGTHHEGLDANIGDELYLPLASSDLISRTPPKVMHILIKTELDTATAAKQLRGAIHDFSPHVPVTNVQTLQQVVSASVTPQRSLAALLLSIAGLAGLIGAAGVYSMIAYVVSWRTREIGIRLALGARREGIAAMIVWQSLRVVLVGGAAGIVAVIFLGRLLRSLLFGIGLADPLTYIITLALLVLLAVIASALPARRASTVEPMQALRME